MLIRSKPETPELLTRETPVRASSWNAERRTFELVLSAGSSVERFDGTGPFDEVLELRGAMAPAILPLLDNHNRFSLDGRLGDVTKVKLIRGELVGLARLSRHSPMAQRVAAELGDGIKFGVSIGYRVTAWAERINQRSKRREKVATAFEILEASIVAIPADQAATTRSLPMDDEETTTTTTPPAPVNVPPLASTTTSPATMTRAAMNVEIRSIASTAGLGDAWANQQIDAEATIDAARAAAFEAMAQRSAAANSIRSTSAVIITDHTDPIAIRSAMADALAHRMAPGVCKLEGRAIQYRGSRILDLVGDLATANGERINLRDQGALLERAVGAHSTSDFPLLLADAANKALLAQYQAAAPTYRKWAAKKPFNDFKPHSFLRLGDFPNFSEIAENGEVKYGSISEKAEKVQAKEFATGIAIGRKALINDDLSALSDFSAMISARSAVFENSEAYKRLKTNAALQSDGIALFHADHKNRATAGSNIAATGVTAAVAALRAQKSLDGLPLNLQPAFLVVGPASEVAARQILAAVMATKSEDVNVWTGLAELIVDAEITNNAWYLFASPGVAPVIVYGYVGGGEGPQIRTERDFDTQAVKVAANLDFAVDPVDFRGAYFNAGG
ncbi:prohead protease/major capsid protein fusion protein [Rhodopseudomonas palustris]|uniref:prohead protease/major capsid protein fusion protein n=1 Tax=Rhodopseudomonas palustris TaxID=1076 RepID=UPI0021F33D49|nr:prohead protease/major capsid protein fusion protein [Rhodopseudomonas palustris]UYO55699.1 Mu-like prophage major head subunit gpT family protein [Rhodopseudomonas palustris]